MATFLAFEDDDQDLAFPSNPRYQAEKRAWHLLYQADLIDESRALYREMVEERRELGFDTTDFTTRMQLENLSCDLMPELLEFAIEWDHQAESAMRNRVRQQLTA